jgi:chorismate mutase
VDSLCGSIDPKGKGDFSVLKSPSQVQNRFAEDVCVEWRVRAIRGATTVSENSVAAMREAVMELLNELEQRNHLHPEQIISATFSVTRDLDAIFPAAIARERPYWDNVALLDVQQMHVEGGLARCIRFLIHVNWPTSQVQVCHPYLREAKKLRPDWDLAQASVPASPAIQSPRR